MRARPLCSTEGCGYRAAFRLAAGNIIMLICHACRGFAIRQGVEDRRITELP